MDLVGILENIGFDFRVFLFNIVNFAIVAGLLYKFLFKKVYVTVQERQALIEQGIANTTKSEQLLAESQQAAADVVHQAQQQAVGILDSAEKQARADSERIAEEARTYSAKVVASAKETAEQEKQQKLDEFRQQAGQIVAVAAKKLVEEEIEIKRNNR